MAVPTVNDDGGENVYGDEALEMGEIAKLKLDHDDYDDLSPQQARISIAKLLQEFNFGVIFEKIKEADFKDFGDYKDGVTSVVADGIVWVKCFADNSGSRAKIKAGKPVIFDMTSAEGVTGIHPDMTPAEYRVIGTALKDFEGTEDEDSDYIPISLKPEPVALSGEIRIQNATGRTLQAGNVVKPDVYVPDEDGFYVRKVVKVDNVFQRRYLVVTENIKDNEFGRATYLDQPGYVSLSGNYPNAVSYGVKPDQFDLYPYRDGFLLETAFPPSFSGVARGVQDSPQQVMCKTDAGESFDIGMTKTANMVCDLPGSRVYSGMTVPQTFNGSGVRIPQNTFYVVIWMHGKPYVGPYECKTSTS